MNLSTQHDNLTNLTDLLAGLALGDGDIGQEFLEELPAQGFGPLADDDVGARERAKGVLAQRHRPELLAPLLEM